MSWNGISWIVCSEIFPLGLRALCQAITTATQWLWQFVIARSTPYMIANIGYGTYLVRIRLTFIFKPAAHRLYGSVLRVVYGTHDPLGLFHTPGK